MILKYSHPLRPNYEFMNTNTLAGRKEWGTRGVVDSPASREECGEEFSGRSGVVDSPDLTRGVWEGFSGRRGGRRFGMAGAADGFGNRACSRGTGTMYFCRVQKIWANAFLHGAKWNDERFRALFATMFPAKMHNGRSLLESSENNSLNWKTKQ